MRFLLLALAATLSTSALAQGGFTLTLAAPAPAARVVARETLWNCTGSACHAPRAALVSDMTECRAASRKLGRVTGFGTAARPFDSASLEKCNAGIAQ